MQVILRNKFGRRVFHGARLVVTVLFLAALSILGADTVRDDWEVHIGLPWWVAGIDGAVTMHGREAKVEEDFSNIADILDFAGAANLELRNKGWLLFANGLYLKTTVDGEPGGLLADVLNEVELEQKTVSMDFGLGYNISRHKAFGLEVFAGGRFQYVDAEISADLPGSDPSFSQSNAWVDPIFGLIARYRLARPLALFTEADVGGFGVSSDLTWQVNAGAEWNLTQHLYLRASYRHLETDVDDEDFQYDIKQSGPQLEFGLQF
jgi:hypothetical protein